MARGKRKRIETHLAMLTMPDGRELDIANMSEQSFRALLAELQSTEYGRAFLREMCVID